MSGPAKSSSSAVGVVVAVVVIIGVVIGGVVSSLGSSGDYDPRPSAKDKQGLAADLAEATKRQGVCYGWSLDFEDDYSYHSIDSKGSNQGAGQQLDTDQCERWVVFRASVTWTSSSSESQDYGYFSVTGSPDLQSDLPSDSQLADVGVDEDTLTDDPYWTTESAMEALPLLIAQTGAATPMPVGSEPADVGAVTPPPKAGSDLWRGHKALIIMGGIGLLAALVFLTGGLLSVRRRRAEASRGPDGGSGTGRGPGRPSGPNGPGSGRRPPVSRQPPVNADPGRQQPHTPPGPPQAPPGPAHPPAGPHQPPLGPPQQASPANPAGPPPGGAAGPASHPTPPPAVDPWQHRPAPPPPDHHS